MIRFGVDFIQVEINAMRARMTLLYARITADLLYLQNFLTRFPNVDEVTHLGVTLTECHWIDLGKTTSGQKLSNYC